MFSMLTRVNAQVLGKFQHLSLLCQHNSICFERLSDAILKDLVSLKDITIMMTRWIQCCHYCKEVERLQGIEEDLAHKEWQSWSEARIKEDETILRHGVVWTGPIIWKFPIDWETDLVPSTDNCVPLIEQRHAQQAKNGELF